MASITPLPDRDRILDVMNDCQCTEARAIFLLKRSRNDCEKAKQFQRTYMKYMVPSRPVTPAPTHTAPVNEIVGLPHRPQGVEIHDGPVAEDQNGDSSDDSKTQLKTPLEGQIPDEDTSATEQEDDQEPGSVNIAQSSSHAYPAWPRMPFTASINSTTLDDAQPLSRNAEYQTPVSKAISPPIDICSSNLPPALTGPDHEDLSKSDHEPLETPAEGMAPASYTSSESVSQDPLGVYFQRFEEDRESVDMPGEEQPMVTEWDYILPLVSPLAFSQGTLEVQDDFDLPGLIGAVQAGAGRTIVQNYLDYYPTSLVSERINDPVEGIPPMFFIVATNNEKMLRMWINYGGDTNAKHQEYKVPLLAFAIMLAETLDTDTTLTVATLLSLGASPLVIPKAFYSPYHNDLSENGPSDKDMEKLPAEDTRWLTESAKKKLARTANLTQRYYLDRAAKTKKPSVRHRQVASRKNAEALLGIPYFLIGQTEAATRLLQKLLSHLALSSRRPLVLVFAGPSGHGKTEMARRLGHLLSLELEVVDCTTFTRETELFGPRDPYVGAEKGSPLNNFLARKHGERAIVFMDEFEKTTTEIHNALLLPFDNGEYQDRRHLNKVDCSKTIWILATNALDATIQNFCEDHHDAIFVSDDENAKSKLMKTLSKELKTEFLTRFSKPITGRISSFIPFLQFSPGEQAVITHKYLLELAQRVRAPINLSTGDAEQLIGNVRLRIRRDASVCGLIAKEEYHMDLGARSLITGVKTIEEMVVDAYLEVDEEITERDDIVDFTVDLIGGEISVKMVHPASVES